MDGTTLTFSPQQIEALDSVARWLKNDTKTKPVFRLFGYAGTGKTTLAKYLAEGLDGEVVYAAYTGKAALMMARNGCVGASTIHQLIYRPINRSDGKIEFRLNRDSDAATAALIVLDECSMVDDRLARDLMSFGKPILALGDPAQLPPIEGEGYFTEAKPDVMLTEVHRQAKESPVLRLATIVREGGALELGTYGSSRVVPDDSLELNEILAADQVLVGRNVTRRYLNEAIRHALGYDTEMPVLGDRLVCLRNHYDLDVFNGGIFTVTNKPHQLKFSDKLSMRVRSVDFPDAKDVCIGVRPEFFTNDEERLSKEERRKSHHFSYGYALTVHKAQGSQWDNVIIDNESGFFGTMRRAWLYTAITRAKERVTIVKER